VTPLLKALLADGYSVQLAHVEAEKDETRDIVRVKTSSGEMVAEDKDMQHNRNYRAIKERTTAMVAAVVRSRKVEESRLLQAESVKRNLFRARGLLA